MNKYKKIGEAEMIIGIGLSFLVYFFCFLLDFTGIGAVITPFIESFFTFGTWLFFKNKGDPFANRVGANIAQYAANLIPFIPSIVIAFITKVYIHNHPKTLAAAGKVAGAATKI